MSKENISSTIYVIGDTDMPGKRVTISNKESTADQEESSGLIPGVNYDVVG